MAKKYDVIVLGDYYLDLIFTGLAQLPELGKEIFSSGFDMLPGGAYNAALTMHRLGLKVGWAGDFGNDDFSRSVLAQARAAGLSDEFFTVHDRPLRRVTVSASYPADRAFITYCDSEPAVPAAMRALAVASAQAVYIAGVYYGKLFDAGHALVRAKGMKLVMDGNSGDEVVLTLSAVRKALQRLDVFLPNAAEARRITGKADLAEAIRVLGELCSLVIIKDGANGAHACAAGQIIHEPGLPVTPVDTTGAGDCFNAGFVCAWLAGKSLRDCLRWGNVVGGLSTTARGGTGRAVNAAEVEAWLE